MDDALFEKAKKLFKAPDMIIDLYDFSIVWMSRRLKKAMELSGDELIGKQVPDYFSINKEKKREKAIELMSKPHGFMTVDMKTKKGGVARFEVDFYAIEFRGGFYHIGRFLKCTKIS